MSTIIPNLVDMERYTISSVSAEALGRSLNLSRKLCGWAPNYVRAYNRASLELAGGSVWTYDVGHQTIEISSASRPGVTYAASFLTCSCKAGEAGKMCWHMGARDLIQRAIDDEHPEPRMTDAEYAALLTETDRWF